MQSWVKNCLSDEQFAHNMGIAYSTLKVWKEKYSAISAALKRGKEVVDREVENALFKRAFDFEYTEQTVKVVDRDKDVIESERREFENRYSLRVLVYLV